MNANKLKAAVKKFTKETTIDEIIAGGYEQDEASEILEALQAPSGPDLSKIDYQNLTGLQFEAYLDALTPMALHEKYDFEEWLATSVIEQEFDRKTGRVAPVMVGIKLNGNKPIMTTRITLRQAIELNKHVNSLNTPESRGTSKYYLMAKEQKS